MDWSAHLLSNIQLTGATGQTSQNGKRNGIIAKLVRKCASIRGASLSTRTSTGQHKGGEPRKERRRKGNMVRSERQKRDAGSEDSESGGESTKSDACSFSAVFGSSESQISTFLQNVQNMTAEVNIRRLLEAAEYLERKDRECEHGYASTFPSIQSSNNYQRQRKFRNKKHSSNHNRSTHNELEKNRKANAAQLFPHTLARYLFLRFCTSSSTLRPQAVVTTAMRCFGSRLKRKETKSAILFAWSLHCHGHASVVTQSHMTLHCKRTRRVSESLRLERREPKTPREEIEVDVESTEFSHGELDSASMASTSDLDDHSSLQSLASDEGYSSCSVKLAFSS
ncbi:hypothetical protein HF521_014304 [Silurus meridionalis]|uniref:Max-interacting protein 1 n=1 Tax=Silurus meridionalis TaxID=175797 RepID=A0A8T0ABC8_SILME|nr:hypothetical protein HF521_014304 [Silurus meridionalis]